MRPYRKPMLRVRGQAELIGALFALMVLVMFIAYIVANILPSATRQQLQMQEMYSLEQLQELEKEGLEAIWNQTSNELTIRNNSTIPVKIVRVWVEKDGKIEPVSVKPEDATIEPGGEKKFSFSATPLRIETSRGTIVDVKTVKPAQEQETQTTESGSEPGFGTEYVAPTLEVLDPASLTSNPNIYIDRRLIEEPTLDNINDGKTSGMVRYLVREGNANADNRYVLVLERENETVCVHVEGIPGVFILGYAPGTDKKLYNALLTGTNRGVVIRVKDCETGEQIDEIRLTSTDRAKILGLNVSNAEFEFRYESPYSIIETNNASEALGYWYYYVPHRIEMRLKIVNGMVEKLKIYKIYEDVEGKRESSYEPYLLTADVDGNGVAELIFIDEDISYGSWTAEGQRQGCCTLNDEVKGGGRYAILDVSTEKFLFYLEGYPIDPEKHGGVMISLRWYFHDNEGADEECIEESGLPILVIYLIDPGEDGELGTQDDDPVASSEYSYQYLTKFEDTYPPNKGYITLTVTLVVPENVTADKLYVAIGFNDPYVYRSYKGSNLDDADITLAVELLGITFLPRST